MTTKKHPERPKHLLGLPASPARDAMTEAWSRYLKAQKRQRRTASALAKARATSRHGVGPVVTAATKSNKKAREQLATAKSEYRTAVEEARAS